ncbi:MAG TPA: TIGR01777 family oxidoreductase [Gemmatimonadaceae bacterium]|nr:TIGR01777 family oxidoreductase [Gemmatimonadaceae bacterium]
MAERRALAAGERARIVVTGATGFIGGALLPALEARGWSVARVVRSAASARDGDIVWDPAGGVVDAAQLDGVDAVVHLAGEPIAQRWSAEAKRRIRESRVQGTRTLVRTIARLDRPPRVLVSASAIGVYGDRGDELLDESSPPGRDFLAEVARAWESEAAGAASARTRVVSPRFGIVLAERGGALAKMLPAFRLGGGGRLGDGRQWMSWVSLDDLVASIVFALEHEELEGAVNVVAPNPVTNAEFTDTLGRVLGRPTLVHVPAFALRLMFGEMADATLLASQRVAPRRLEGAGFRFRHARLEEALRAALA